MKKLSNKIAFTLILLAYGINFVMAQTYDRRSELSIQNPTSSEIAKFGLTPVNQYTGKANINVPLFSHDFDGKNIAFNLNYDSGGIKTNQEASWIGLGWNLTGIPTINHQVNQYSDIGNFADGRLYPRGYCYEEPVPSFMSSTYLETLSEPQGLNGLTLDTQPDIFVANLFNETIKFVLTQKQVTGSVSAILINDSNAVITYDETNGYFTIVDEYGFKYEFKHIEYTTTYAAGYYDNYAVGQPEPLNAIGLSDIRFNRNRDSNIPMTWYVDKVISPDGFELDFKYYGEEDGNRFFQVSTPNYFESKTEWICAKQQGNGNYANNLPGISADHSLSQTIQEVKILKEIVDKKKGTRIVFKTGQREDLWPYSTNLYNTVNVAGVVPIDYNENDIRKLDQMEVYASNGVLKKKIAFYHSYFDEHKLGEPNDELYLRLKLDGVTVDNNAFSMVYDRPNSLPSKHTRDVDFWGYYNGAQNSVRYPSIPIQSGMCTIPDNMFTNYGDIINGASFGSDFQFGSIGSLKELHYPTGGFSRFEYESNTAKIDISDINDGSAQTTYFYLSENNLETGYPVTSPFSQDIKTFKVGGLRIAKNELFDRNNQKLLSKRYLYDLNPGVISSESYGRLMNPLFYFHIQNANYDGNSVVMDLVNTSNMNRAIINNSASGSHIGYDRVEEIISHVDSNSPDNGKIVTEFYNKPNDKIGSGYSGQVGLAVDVPPINFEEYNGRILKQETFNRNGVIKLREQRDYLYRNLGLVYAFKVYYAVISSVINGGQSSYGLNKFKNSLILGYSNYNYPSSSLTYTLPYDYYPYRIFTRYSLASRITRTEFSDSGDETITIIDQGYNEKDRLASTEFTNSEGEIVKSEYFYPYDTEYSVNSYSRMSSLVARNSIMNPVYSRNYLDNQLLGHELTAYDFFNGNLRPLNIAFQKQDAPLDQIEKRIEYLEYDVNGNPTLSKKDGGPLTQLLWGYEYTYPIAKIDNVDENSTPINEILDEAVISNSTSNDSEIEQELLKIRQHPDYENSLMSSHTYNILAGMTTNTDSRGHRTSFHYDDRERLIEIKDDDSHLLEDYEYDLAYETADCLEGCTNTVSLSTSDYQVFRNQNFTISYSISGTFTIARWELWYGDDTFQNGTGVPAGLSHSYGSDESYGLKPIRLFLYDSNDTLITGNINVRLSPGNIPGGDVYFGNISSQNSNPLSARIYADPGSEITYSISVGAGGNVNAMSTSVAVGGQSNQLAAYESQNNTIVVPAQGYIDCTIATTLNGADFANITLTIQGTDRGQVVSPSSVLQSISN